LLNIKQIKDRDFNELDIDSKEEMIEFVKTYFNNKPLSIKYAPEKGEARVNDFLKDGSVMVLTNPEFLPEHMFTLYGLLDKYIEIDLLVQEIRGPGYFKCTIEKVRRAATMRKEIRFKLSPTDVVAANFKLSKYTIDITNFKMPTGIKVLLDQFESRNSALSDIVRVGVFDKEDIILKHIRKTGETLFIEDISKSESYKPESEVFVDLNKLMGNDLPEFIRKNIEKGYKSIIIAPVIYITDQGKPISFAYIQLISKTVNFTQDMLITLKDMITKLIDRIRVANTILLQVHQEITDISKSGAKLRITDPELKKYIGHARGFIFDIIFRLQAPITIYGDIKSSYTDEKGDMYVGVDFEGISSRPDEMKRFTSMIDPLIKEYKARLIKELKRGKKNK
jgi:hypothetical protein